MAGNGIEDDGAVFDVVGKGADLVEGRCISDEAVARYEAVRRFEADDAAVGGRLTDRSARIGTEGPNGRTGSNSCSRTAGRTAGDAVEVPRVVRFMEGRVFRRAAMANSSMLTLPKLM